MGCSGSALAKANEVEHKFEASEAIYCEPKTFVYIRNARTYSFKYLKCMAFLTDSAIRIRRLRGSKKDIEIPFKSIKHASEYTKDHPTGLHVEYSCDAVEGVDVVLFIKLPLRATVNNWVKEIKKRQSFDD